MVGLISDQIGLNFGLQVIIFALLNYLSKLSFAQFFVQIQLFAYK